MDDITLTGQRVRWSDNCIAVDQDRAIEELTEIVLDKSLPDTQTCIP